MSSSFCNINNLRLRTQSCSTKFVAQQRLGNNQVCRSRDYLKRRQTVCQVSFEDVIHRITTCGKIVGEVHTEAGNQGFMMGHYDMQTKKEPYLYYWVDTSNVKSDILKELENEHCIQVVGDILSPTRIVARNIREMTNPSDDLVAVPSPIQKQQSGQRQFQKLSYQDSMPVNVIEREVPKEPPALWEHLFQHPGDYWDMRTENPEGSRFPSFIHKTLTNRKLFVDDRTPADIRAKLQEGVDMPAAYPGWSLLLSKPSAFWRHPNKMSDKQPDFLHKPTSCPVWFNVKTADQQQTEFMEFLEVAPNAENPPVEDEMPADPWQDVFNNPQNWEDLRESKTNPRQPDFRDAQYRNGIALWLSDAPPDFREQLESASGKLNFARSKLQIIRESWQDLIDNPENWKDFRTQKQEGKVKPNFPDFKSLDNQVALWIDSGSTPLWVAEQLQS